MKLADFFLKRHTQHEQTWSSVSQLWSLKQTLGQNETQTRANRINLPEDQILQIIIHGTLPGIRNCVLHRIVKPFRNFLFKNSQMNPRVILVPKFYKL